MIKYLVLFAITGFGMIIFVYIVERIKQIKTLLVFGLISILLILVGYQLSLPYF